MHDVDNDKGKRKDNNTQLHMRFYTDSYKTKNLCTLCMIHVGTDDKRINMDRVLVILIGG